MDLQGEIEGKDLLIIQHPVHDHPLVLRESLQSHGGCYGGGSVQVYCDGCRKPISSSFSSSSSSGVGGGGGTFYACTNSDCWFLLHKRCAELPPKIEHPSHLDHALTLSHFILDNHSCDVCDSSIDGFLYRCSDCDFDVHVRCASIALHIQDRVDENYKIHQHPLIPIEVEAQVPCAACGREHKGKSYLCSTCGFWANQICASAPTTVDLHIHPHPFTLFRSFRYSHQKICIICNEEVKTASWIYRCSEGCGDSVHVGCSLSEKAKNSNSNKDIQPNLHSESTSYKTEIPSWPVPDESTKLMTQLIKKLSLQGTHERATKILRCKNDHQLIFVNKKIDESKDDQLCDGCAQTISSQFYHCVQCNFSLHGWCAELPNQLNHRFHQQHPLRLRTQQQEPICSHASTLISNVHTDKLGHTRTVVDTLCSSCYMLTDGFVYGCFTCDFYLDLKCASLPRSIKHRVHDHNLALRRETNKGPCNACGVNYFRYFTFFRCEACNFGLCIKCALLPSSIRHRYDKHPFALTCSPIKDQPNEYHCEICEKDINSMYWFYHCIKCDQSLHPECIYPIERYMIMKFGARFEVNFHSHLLSFVRGPKAGVLAPCHGCGRHFEALDYMAYECEQCDFWMHRLCFYSFQKIKLTTSMTPPN
ncbi:uncharacterized protein LOC127789028 isoform X2 [Diospyros lotus]|uniref:uncharacterized protein LOC127789028 isoform X2 n=1 Tax=Diospyros lotus TaxID=55363 RepID=UPI002254CF66|nr:uncharacterized protein LOC127789028 isoform X2 [Diospyros lotus]